MTAVAAGFNSAPKLAATSATVDSCGDPTLDFVTNTRRMTVTALGHFIHEIAAALDR